MTQYILDTGFFVLIRDCYPTIRRTLSATDEEPDISSDKSLPLSAFREYKTERLSSCEPMRVRRFVLSNVSRVR